MESKKFAYALNEYKVQIWVKHNSNINTYLLNKMQIEREVNVVH